MLAMAAIGREENKHYGFVFLQIGWRNKNAVGSKNAVCRDMSYGVGVGFSAFRGLRIAAGGNNSQAKQE